MNRAACVRVGRVDMVYRDTYFMFHVFLGKAGRTLIDATNVRVRHGLSRVRMKRRGLQSPCFAQGGTAGTQLYQKLAQTANRHGDSFFGRLFIDSVSCSPNDTHNQTRVKTQKVRV